MDNAPCYGYDMMVNVADGDRRDPHFPSGLMRRLGYEDAFEGRERQHGSKEYDQGYRQGLADSGRTDA